MDASSSGPRTLSVDIGGTGMKMLVLDSSGKPITDRLRELTPRPARPEAVMALLQSMASALPAFDRVSVGFPGVVQRGIVKTAPNLDTEQWRDVNLESELERIMEKPVRVINDADLQGFGVISGHGVELTVTLGTGMGAALFTDGRLVPNLELGHHPFEKGRTYEERVCDAELRRIGKQRWNERVARVIAQLEPIFNYDVLHLGGGNARKVRFDLPHNVRVFASESGLAGGIRLWEATLPRAPESREPLPERGHDLFA
jgi:polyphosphate glucokinase